MKKNVLRFITLTVCSTYTFVIGIVTLAILHGNYTSIFEQYRLLYSAALLVLCVAILKIFIKAKRPKGSTLYAWGNTFPSGHATLSAFFAINIVYYLYLIETKTVILYLSLFFGILFSISLGLTRIQYKLHFYNDILFGWLLGIYWFLITIYL